MPKYERKFTKAHQKFWHNSSLWLCDIHVVMQSREWPRVATKVWSDIAHDLMEMKRIAWHIVWWKRWFNREKFQYPRAQPRCMAQVSSWVIIYTYGYMFYCFVYYRLPTAKCLISLLSVCVLLRSVLFVCWLAAIIFIQCTSQQNNDSITYLSSKFHPNCMLWPSDMIVLRFSMQAA